MNPKFQYHIIPDRMYTITFEGQEYRVLGAALMSLYVQYGDLDTLEIS